MPEEDHREGLYLMPSGLVASVDLGDGRRSLVSRAKFEECCCPDPPICGPNQPDEILLESANASRTLYTNSSCDTVSSVQQVRLKEPVILTFAGTIKVPCLWEKQNVVYEVRTDSGSGFGSWVEQTEYTSVRLAKGLFDPEVLWRFGAGADGGLGLSPTKNTGSSPIGTYTLTKNCEILLSNTYGDRVQTVVIS